MNSVKPRQIQDLVGVFKTLADESRLTIIRLVSERERDVGELADLLDLKEPTVSYHLSKLREQGLLSLRASGNNRFYRLNSARLDRVKDAVQHLEHMDVQMPDRDSSWIDALDLDEQDRHVLRGYTQGRMLKAIPVKHKKLRAVLRWLITYFELDVIYTEHEVNEILAQYHHDYVTLRRELIDYGYLDREKDGSTYWMVSDPPAG